MAMVAIYMKLYHYHDNGSIFCTISYYTVNGVEFLS